MLGERQQAAAAELAQWWDGIRQGGVGSHTVLLAGPAGWGRSTVLDQLPRLISAAGRPVGLEVRINGKSLPDEPSPQAAAVRESLLGADVRQQAAALLYRSRLRGPRRLGTDRLLPSGIAGTISLLLASLAAAAAGSVADDDPASENGAAARAARIVAAVSASVPTLVLIDDADELAPDLAVTVIENLIDGHDSKVLVAAAVDPGSDVAAALISRARYGPTAGRVHRAGADPRMGSQSRAELVGELGPHLTEAQVQELAGQTRTFAEIFAAVRPETLS
jgi:AAA ATPase domain